MVLILWCVVSALSQHIVQSSIHYTPCLMAKKVDDAFNAWLIEINSSPACDYSTPTTERYVKQALPELLQVVLDRADAEVEKGTLANKLCGGLNVQASTIDKGGWKCIHKGSYVEAPQATFGVDLVSVSTEQFISI